MKGTAVDGEDALKVAPVELRSALPVHLEGRKRTSGAEHGQRRLTAMISGLSSGDHGKTHVGEARVVTRATRIRDVTQPPSS